MADSIEEGRRLIAYDGGLTKRETVEYAAAKKVRIKLEALNEAVLEAESLLIDVDVSRKARKQPFTAVITQRL